MINKQRQNMQGSIRFLVGLLVTFGAVGGIDNNEELLAPLVLSVLGLALMFSGVLAMNKKIIR